MLAKSEECVRVSSHPHDSLCSSLLAKPLDFLICGRGAGEETERFKLYIERGR